jgi:hypothetical protein
MLAAAVLAAVTAQPAHAQARAQEVGAGPTPGWTFTPSVSLGWLYDTNVGFVDPGVGFEKQEDHLFLIVPAGDLDYVGRHTRLSGGYRGSLHRYRTLDALNTYEQRGSLSFTHQVARRLTLFGRGSILRAPTTDELDLEGVLFRRIGATRRNASGGVDVALSKLTTLHAGYEFTWVDFERTNFPGFLSGGLSHGLDVDVRRRLTERLSMGGTYSLRFALLDIAEDPLTGLGDGTLQFQNAGVTAGYDPTRSLSLSGALGVAILTDRRLAPENQNNIGPFVRVGLTHTGERMITTVGYQRSAVPTFGFAASSMSEQIRGSVYMPVARNRVYVQGDAAWRRTDPLIQGQLDLHSYWTRSTVGVTLARALRLESYYAFSRQDSRIPGGLVVRHRVGAQVVLGHPMRIR